MSYVTPITNRQLSDVVNKTPIGYFNVSDWVRIYGNALYINAEMAAIGHAVTFITASTPTTSSIPSITDVNNLLTNIDNMRQYVNTLLAEISPFATLLYVVGAGGTTPSYLDINQWELTIDLIKQFLDIFTIADVICGVATTNGDVIIDSI